MEKKLLRMLLVINHPKYSLNFVAFPSNDVKIKQHGKLSKLWWGETDFKILNTVVRTQKNI